MKTLFHFSFILQILILSNTLTYGQIKIISNGNVGIGTSNPASKLEVQGSTTLWGNIQIFRGEDPENHLFVGAETHFDGNVGINNLHPAFPLDVSGTSHFDGNVGINVSDPIFPLHVKGNSFFSTVSYSSWGIKIDDTGYMGGAAIYPVGPNYLGKSTNPWYEFWVNQPIHVSDERFKTNILDIENALSRILKVRTIKYDLSEYYFTKSNNSSSLVNSPSAKNRFGFLAQDLLTLFPEVVAYDSATDVYGVKYTEMIPVIVAAIKEQQKIIEDQNRVIQDLQNVLNGSKKAAEINSNLDDNIAYILQNRPNPFDQTTEIEYFLPEETQNAIIYLFNMEGNILESVPLTSLGHSSIEIDGGRLQAGMYIYSLIVNGTEIDSKRMILTK